MTPLELFALLRIVFGISILVIIGSQIWCTKRLGEPLAWGFVILHSLIYNVAFLIAYKDTHVIPSLYNAWSSILNIHYLIVIASVEGTRLYRMKVLKKGENNSGCK